MWQLKCATSSMHKKRKNPIMEQQTCEKGPKLGFKELPTYKSLHCRRTTYMAFPIIPRNIIIDGFPLFVETKTLSLQQPKENKCRGK